MPTIPATGRQRLRGLWFKVSPDKKFELMSQPTTQNTNYVGSIGRWILGQDWFQSKKYFTTTYLKNNLKAKTKKLKKPKSVCERGEGGK
jgi:hypothetical protein